MFHFPKSDSTRLSFQDCRWHNVDRFPLIVRHRQHHVQDRILLDVQDRQLVGIAKVLGSLEFFLVIVGVVVILPCGSSRTGPIRTGKQQLQRGRICGKALAAVVSCRGAGGASGGRGCRRLLMLYECGQDPAFHLQYCVPFVAQQTKSLVAALDPNVAARRRGRGCLCGCVVGNAQKHRSSRRSRAVEHKTREQPVRRTG